MNMKKYNLVTYLTYVNRFFKPIVEREFIIENEDTKIKILSVICSALNTRDNDSVNYNIIMDEIEAESCNDSSSGLKVVEDTD